VSEDKELVEVWRKEFELWYDAHTRFNYGVAYYFGADGKYCFDDIELAWQSFLVAKRAQPVVELPKRGQGYYLDDMINLDEVIESLTAAGIKYTVGE
jgi:hypothetical protein